MKNIILIMISITAFSCVKENEFINEDIEDKIVINGIINPDSTVNIRITKTMDYDINDDIEFIDNAVVTIQAGTGNKVIMENISNGFYNAIDFYPAIGEDYQLNIKMNEKALNAKCRVPEPAKIQSIDSIFKENRIQCTVKFTDDANKENFYMLGIYGVFNGDMVSLDFEIMNINIDRNQFINKELLFNDELFNGKNAGIIINVNPQKLDKLYFTLKSIDKSFYLYCDNYLLNENVNNDIFSEYVEMYTNIEGGVGLFTAYSQHTDSLILK